MAIESRTTAVLALGLAVLVALLLAGWSMVRDDKGGPYAFWNFYRPFPDGIEVFKTVRSCDELSGAHVEEESGERVVVAVEVDGGGVCGDDAVDKSVMVELDSPLNGRPVYDAVCLTWDRPESDCLREVG